ncbi:MAG: methylenetetrahydrofolate reductase [NAD(P)H] [Bacteroidales bacterium]|nr:methylenetetrahydrofolate reductase [NAD(P)H] [Bacteroidales bacterium]
MKIKDIIAAQKKPFASLEIVPPLKGVTQHELLESIRPFMEFKPPFINVTSHRDEVEFRQEPDGTFTRHTVRRRLSETAVCASIQAAFDVEVVPHLICGGATAERIEDMLSDFRFLGIENVLALRGDSLLGEKRFTPEPGGYRFANELVAAVRRFGASSGSEFCIGVGGYPEKHFEAPNMETDIANLKRKVEAGADFIITQMFFDNSHFYEFRDRCRFAGIDVPVIPGLKPLSSARQLESIPDLFSLDIPQALVRELQTHSDDKSACYQIGLEWCSAQVADLLKNGVPAVHFYTMGRPDNTVEIIRRHF